VPLVINKGGQPETVQHGISGFVWENLGELKMYTEMLMRDEALRARLAEAARARAAFFSREQFINRFLSLINELEPSNKKHQANKIVEISNDL